MISNSAIIYELIHTLEDACEDDRDPREDEEDMERVEAERTCKIRIIFMIISFCSGQSSCRGHICLNHFIILRTFNCDSSRETVLMPSLSCCSRTCFSSWSRSLSAMHRLDTSMA